MEMFSHDGDERVDAGGDPELGLDGVLRSSQERLDPQILLDPFEEQFHLPSRLLPKWYLLKVPRYGR